MAGIDRLLAKASLWPGKRPDGRQVHLPRHAAVKAALRKRTGKVAAGVAVAATLAGGAAAWGASAGTSHGAGTLTAMAVASPASHQVSGAGALAAGASKDTARPAKTVAVSKVVAEKAAARKAAEKAAAEKAAARKAAEKAAARKAAARKAAAEKAAAARSATATVSCNTSYGMLPANVTTIVSFLLAHGYSANAAAGIAGNMYQESQGNPESVGTGGGGLIGFTPLPSGYVTGNVAADLQTQLNAVLSYNQQWAGYLPALNSAATPAAAAYIYVTDFERAGIPAASNREASAQNVAAACGI